ncbi:hypothetical protein EG328_004357 [Venturia inaequalis]|uniref:Phosphatidylinositol N-acetylglucosaminyltransferase subunit H conserved domain-containing protein n=1 Tax=Venturia inaequalis TaxID=5025 RepID=A0A8H3VDV1_VENIN|nr:hypothetical protein EG328_004357 [Venturia inaequalis]KAE9989044.1 hypothetical protein EG327_003130 [Venturia inaequalis]RDI81087.1 hypothetical protein Vi05172_g8961 [Venturia inaequalis]
MPSPPCNLRINRPTPTTVSFTVSTRAPLTTLTSRLIHYTAAVSRIIIAASIILILTTKWCLWSTKEGWNHLPEWLGQSLPGQGAKLVAENAMAMYLVPVSMAVLWLCARRGYTEESLLILRTLGIQTTTSSPTYLSTSTTRFIPTTSIQDIFIHEAFKGFEVRFYLAIIVEGEQDVVVVFPVSKNCVLD